MTALSTRAKKYKLSTRDIRTLGLEMTEFNKRLGIKIPYYSNTGESLEMFRVRFADKIEPKYGQPTGLAPRIYFPALLNWQKISAEPEPTTSVIVVEGEWKAIYLAKLGYAAIGLGGVWNWRTKNGPLRDWELLGVRGRNFTIAFDSDVLRNQDVADARDALSAMLTGHGGVVRWLDVPDLDETSKSTGIDDYLMAQPDPEASLNALLIAANTAEMNTQLAEMNRRYCHILSTSTRGVWDSKTRSLISYQVFDRETKNRKIQVGNVRVNASTIWLDWPGRNQATGFVFRPHEAPGLTEDRKWNHVGPKPEPVKGDVSPFLDLLKHLLQNDPKQLDWVLGWCAHPFRSTERLFQALFLYSTQEGAGKGQLARLLGLAHGLENTADVSFATLNNQFSTALVARKTLVVVDEGTSSGYEAREVSGLVKKLITDPMVSVNQKYQPVYEIENQAAFLITTNHLSSLQISGAARRYFVIEGPRLGKTPSENQLPKEVVDRINNWVESGLAGPNLVHFFQHYRSRKFSNKAIVVSTAALEDVVETMRSSIDEFARACVHDGAWEGKPIPEIATIDYLLKLYQSKGHGTASRQGLGIAIKQAGGSHLTPPVAGRGKRMVCLNGTYVKPVVLRNGDRWQGATHAAIVSYLTATQENRLTDPMNELVAAREALRRAKERVALAVEAAKSLEIQAK